MHEDREGLVQHSSLSGSFWNKVLLTCSRPKAISMLWVLLAALLVIVFFLLARDGKNDRLRILPIRLVPGDDVLDVLNRTVEENGLKSAWIASVVGSVTTLGIRYANQSDTTVLKDGPYEIVALSGTLSQKQSPHLHVSVGDGAGNTISGHLSGRSSVFTTVEIVLQSSCGYVFERVVDPTTHFEELSIVKRKWC